jgi:uncharacterized OsmC-like protein
MNREIDSDIIEPSIDPETKKIGVRSVKGVNFGGTNTAIKIRDFDVFYTDEPSSLGGTNTAPSPLETTLAALIGCDGVIINGVAKAINFEYAGVELECESQIDIRGPKGVPGIRPYFESAKMKITVYTDESEDRFKTLEKNVEYRCPVMNLFRAAGVVLEVDWQKEPASHFKQAPE